MLPARKLLLAEADPNVRGALVVLLTHQPEFVVVGNANTLQELLTSAHAHQPDLIVVDWQMLGPNAADSLELLRSAAPSVAFVALSMRDEQRAEALQAGVAAFVCKGQSPSELLKALRA